MARQINVKPSVTQLRCGFQVTVNIFCFLRWFIRGKQHKIAILAMLNTNATMRILTTQQLNTQVRNVYRGE
jgi:hypothetical protein